jgi:excisionase family DNA binding protein
MAPRRITTDEERVAYRPREFARRTGLSDSAVYDAIARRELKSTRLGGSILIPASELQRVREASGA